jgi:hypothetical protein
MKHLLLACMLTLSRFTFALFGMSSVDVVDDGRLPRFSGFAVALGFRHALVRKLVSHVGCNSWKSVGLHWRPWRLML